MNKRGFVKKKYKYIYRIYKLLLSSAFSSVVKCLRSKRMMLLHRMSLVQFLWYYCKVGTQQFISQRRPPRFSLLFFLERTKRLKSLKGKLGKFKVKRKMLMKPVACLLLSLIKAAEDNERTQKEKKKK